MPVLLAYLAMVLIWSTVPLAVKWSVDGPGWLLAGVGRYLVAALFLAAVLALRRVRLPLDRGALPTYLLAGVSFFSFIASNWGIRHVPSGWMGVMWGMAPLATAVWSALWLGERSLTGLKVAGLLLGIAGLGVVFVTAADFGPGAALGMTAVLATVVVNSMSAVWIKRLGAPLPALNVTAGGVFFALPAYALAWLLLEDPAGGDLPLRAVVAMGYLGVVGTGVAFMLMYYVLRHLEPTRVALIGMVTPVLALMLGHLLAGEPLSARIGAGTAMIVCALLLHEYLPRRLARPRLHR